MHWLVWAVGCSIRQMTVLEVLDLISIRNSWECGNSDSTAVCRRLDKPEVCGVLQYGSLLHGCWWWLNVELWWSDS
jgi:hypothetical protein